MLKPKYDDEFFDLLMQDFNEEEAGGEFFDKKRMKRVFVAS
jgi:hypothetical protein